MNLTREDLDEIVGLPVFGSDGEKAGQVEDVFLDDQSQRPEWLRLETGFLGRSHVLVPVEVIERTLDGLTARVPAEAIKDAPKVDADYIPPEAESDLYRYYGLAPVSPSELNEARGAPSDPKLTRPPVTPELGEPPMGDRLTDTGIEETEHFARRGEGPRLTKWPR